MTASENTTSVVTVTSVSPTPSTFQLAYSDAPNSLSYARLSPDSERPGTSGTLIVFSNDNRAAPFSFNDLSQLKITSSNAIIEKNARDPYPYLFVEDGSPTAANAPVCSACNGTLSCDYQGTTGNRFALCGGFLSLGVDSALGNGRNNGRCQVVELQVLPFASAT